MTDEEIIEKIERENITLASISARSWAYFIDEIIVSLLFIIIYWSYIPENADIETTINTINNMVPYALALKIIYHTLFVFLYGATIGKILLKIRVISVMDFENPSFLYSLNRALMRIVSESFFYIGFLWAFFNPKKETWHDKFGRTLVVNAF
jgi:uncharacterized RDD family membrane protein YckC